VFLQESLKQLEAIARTYDTSLSEAENREAEFENVLAEAFEPFMSGCDNMAKSMELPDSAVFTINCRLAAVSCLSIFEFTTGRTQGLQEQAASQAKRLVQSQYTFLRQESGLDSLLTELEEAGSKAAARVFDRETLGQASQGLDDFLPSALMDAMERLRHLQDSGLAREVTEEAAGQFCVGFERLEDAVVKADEDRGVGEEDADSLRSVFPRTTAEIRVLLS
jgi:hypothetical protein